MKSGTVKFKVEGRQSVSRRRLSKSSFNGGGPSAAAAVSAYHIASPCETDHIYAVKDLVVERENMQLRKMVVSHLDMIGQLREELAHKTRQVYPLFDEKLRVVRRDRRMCLVRYQERAPPVLATRYFGRKSKTIPNRALKRRYMGPPKSIPSRPLPPVPEQVAPPLSDTPNTTHKEEPNTKVAIKSTIGAKRRLRAKAELNNAQEASGSKTRRRAHAETSNHEASGSKTRSRIHDEPSTHQKIRSKEKEEKTSADHLTTDAEYFLPDIPSPESPTQPPHIDVPLWKLKPVTSFYQMEGTENINDPVYQRRHQKYELDERRRKRWDLQRLREQRAKNERMRKKRERDDGNPASFFPDPHSVESIEVTDHLPVLAFGLPVPLFPPCDFSLPWTPQKSPVVKGRRGRPPSKVT